MRRFFAAAATAAVAIIPATAAQAAAPLGGPGDQPPKCERTVATSWIVGFGADGLTKDEAGKLLDAKRAKAERAGLTVTDQLGPYDGDSTVALVVEGRYRAVLIAFRYDPDTEYIEENGTMCIMGTSS